MIQQKKNLIYIAYLIAKIALVTCYTNKFNPCDIYCPDVHVETCTPTYHCTTQTYDVPRSGCYRCCSPPLPAASHVSPCYPFQCHMPHYPPHANHPAPAYCVQSVVVGGTKHDLHDTSKTNKTSHLKQLDGDKSIILNCNCNGKNDGNLEPSDSSVQSRIVDSKDTPNNNDRYEKYVEKLLNMIEDKLEAESSPMVVVAEPPPEVRVKTLRRKKQKKYKLASYEAAEPIVMVEEEEEPSYILHPRPSCRHCLTSCCCC
ncbi:uncharacterized protein LOC106669528 [Cimex lectularius]|uniref:Uncharacterized protein n=1 Tax=Cimex lectularius TaxID=79782 RepID=A0A8I6RY54_CIMLE|nr:uncharacterized protein LOC106669528 [Cimex lectularius]